jgi:hypothetical protein
LVAAAVAAVASLTLGAGPAVAALDPTRENAVFWYQGNERSERWARASRVVSLQADPDLIHANGSEAWKYGQISWFPDARPSWNGTTPAQRTPWRLCRADAPDGVPDLTMHAPELWWWADYNERGYSDAMVAWANSVKAEGWDGLFFDTVGYTFNGPERNTVSTCTSDPIVPGIRQRNAYVNLARRIHEETGLGIALNNPPVDVVDAHLGTWLEWYLRENAGNTTYPPETLYKNVIEDSRHPFTRVVGMGKSPLAPSAPGKRQEELYAFGRAKLSGQMAVVNTGDDQCPGGAPGAFCLRMGVPTDLVGLRLGPVNGPLRLQSCDDPASKRCVYLRRFEKGFVAVNPTTKIRRLEIVNARCHRMYRIRAGWLFSGVCSRQLRTNLGPHTAWIVSYRA